MPHHLSALLFDLGDTIMIEESEVKDSEETTLQADLIPGMAEALRRFKAQGLRLAIVADSRPDTPPNVLRQHGLYGYLTCWRSRRSSASVNLIHTSFEWHWMQWALQSATIGVS